MLLRYILFWFALMLIAIANGALRELSYGKKLSELSAHQISTATGILFSGLAVWTFNHSHPLETSIQAWTVGIIWLTLTLLFEFIAGHYIAKESWAKLFEDYNLLAGRVWIIFLLWILDMPYIFYQLSKINS